MRNSIFNFVLLPQKCWIKVERVGCDLTNISWRKTAAELFYGGTERQIQLTDKGILSISEYIT